MEADHQAGQASGRSVPSPQVAGPRRHEQERSGPAPRLPDRAATDGQPGQVLTGDLWVTVYRGDAIQQGEDVESDCTDSVLETVYANGPLDTIGNDVVLWAVVRAHHEPRHEGGSSTTCLITTKSSRSHLAISRCSGRRGVHAGERLRIPWACAGRFGNSSGRPRWAADSWRDYCVPPRTARARDVLLLKPQFKLP